MSLKCPRLWHIFARTTEGLAHIHVYELVFCPKCFTIMFAPSIFLQDQEDQLSLHQSLTILISTPLNPVCFLTFHRIIMSLARASSCAGTALQNSWGWTGNVRLFSPRQTGTRENWHCPHCMCENLIYLKRSESLLSFVHIKKAIHTYSSVVQLLMGGLKWSIVKS